MQQNHEGSGAFVTKLPQGAPSPIPRDRRMLLFSLVVSGVFVAVLLRQVDLHQSWQTLAQVNPRATLLPLAIFLFLSVPLRAWRWQMIFSRASRPSFWKCVRVMSIGNTVNNLLPGRAGDLIRCALVGRGVSAGSEALGTLGVEKVLDGLALLAVVQFSLHFVSAPHWVWRLSIISAACFGAASLVLLLLRLRTSWLVSHIRRIPIAGEKIGRLMTSFANGLAAVTSWRGMMILLLLTGFVWLADAAIIWSLAKALHIALSFGASIMISAVLGLSQTVPAAPASLGAYEFFGVAAFGLVGVASSRALALTVVLHGWVFVAVTGFGLLCIAWAGLRFSQIRGLGTLPAAQTEKVPTADDVTAAKLYTDTP